MARQRIGIIYGAFDPIHLEHLRLAVSLLTEEKADQVFLLPLNPPDDVCMAGPEDRWKMTVAACSGMDRVTPNRTGLSSAEGMTEADIRKLFRKEYPGANLSLFREPDSPVRSLSSRSLMSLSFLDASTLEYIGAKGLYHQEQRIPQAGEWLETLFSTLKAHRFAHTLSVALTARRLAEIHGLNVYKAEQAGLLHDCAKCMPLPEMQRIVRENRLTDDPSILCNAGLLHSFAGVIVAQEKYGMKDPDVLEAVACHTTGAPGMSRLAMCVCLADSIEDRRQDYPGLKETRLMAEHSLERALLMSLDASSAYVRSRNKSLHPRTMNTIAWLKTLPAVCGNENDKGE